mmetsp:Transcript_14385/g.34023  ORF Transcript_14385/g.34023 Transcript_14385/m.34023 type:complete len:258 (+) Transcript_14385:98-871(+)
MDPYEASCLGALQETVVQQRTAALQRETTRLARQRAFLREERRRARQEELALKDEAAALDHVGREDWWPAESLRGAGDPSKRLRLRVGGQDFEVSREALCQDKHSMLYALCQPNSPALVPGEGGLADTVVVDRDWWLFRFVVIFLRDGLIPEDRGTALQLYREASFWRLSSLQRAIEEAHLDLTRKPVSLEGEKPPPKPDQFWKTKKNWWESKPAQEPTKNEAATKAWWYNDPLSEEFKKEKKPASPPPLSTIWGYR